MKHPTRRDERPALPTAAAADSTPPIEVEVEAWLAARPYTAQVGHTLVRETSPEALRAAVAAEEARQRATPSLVRSAAERRAYAAAAASSKRRARRVAEKAVGHPLRRKTDRR